MAVAAETCPQCGGSIAHGYGNKVTCQYCGSSLVRLNQMPPQIPGGEPPPVPGANQDAAAAGMWGVRMKRATYTDVKSGLVAWQWLIPADWEFKGDIWWRDSATLPAIPSFRAWNPNGSEQIEWLPTIPCMWHKNILTDALTKLGKTAHFFKEDGIESRAPLTSPEVLRSLVVPRYRGLLEGQGSNMSISSQSETPEFSSQIKSSMWDFSGGFKDYFSKKKIKQRMEQSKELLKQIPGLESAGRGLKNLVSPRYKPYGVPVRIVKEELMPKLALSLRGGQEDVFNPLSSDGARIRISYNLDGKQMEEDIFCVVSKVVTQTGMGLGKQEHIFWTAEALYAFRASAGNLDAVGQACMASVKSFRMNPQWLQACRAESNRILQVRAMLAKMMQQMAADQRRSLQQLGDLSRSISDAGDSIMGGYWERSAAHDRMGENISEAIRGVDSYIDPTSDYTPELPGGYDHAWSNGLGEYIVANDSLYNPNLNSNMNWTEMERRS
ncbi:MAG: hypothetical protein JW896_18395 [Deltaproteobacteria bacterium]|nr:hypothetical protein [Deltaproteobacteria bacterium]